MEFKKSVESIRDFTIDMWAAGKLVVASVIEKADRAAADSINSPEDN
jgi:hypothetical protein